MGAADPTGPPGEGPGSGHEARRPHRPRAAVDENGGEGGSGGTDPVRRVLLAASLGLLVLVGVLGESAAKPDLGPRGWAPGELPWNLTSGWTSGALAAAYLLGAAAVARGLLRRPSRSWSWLGVLALGLLLLLTQPFGSADHTNYVAYGQIALHGGDPYEVAPAQWLGGTDPIAGRVEPPWSGTPSVYGPVTTGIAVVAAWVGHDNLRQAVWCWQALIVLAWLGVRWLLRRLTDDHARIDVLWTANPLVVGVLLLGAHADVLATTAALTALLALARGGRAAPVLAGLAAGVAASTKLTYGVVGVAVVVGWLAAGRAWGARSPGSVPVPLRSVLGRTVALVGAAAVVVVPLHLWAGPHVLDQLTRSRRAISLATPWRLLFDQLRGHGSDATLRSVLIAVAALACIVLAVLLWRLTAGVAAATPLGQAARASAVLSAAYVLGAPYSLPWYDGLVWACLPLLLPGVLDAVALARGTVVALAYVPGRVVGMSPRVETLTLGFREHVAPWFVLAIWVGIVTAAVGRASRWSATRSARAARPSGR